MGQIKNIKLHIVTDIKKKKQSECHSSETCRIPQLRMKRRCTNSLDLCPLPTRTSWTSSVLAVTRSPRCSVMHRPLCCVCPAQPYSVSPLVVVQGSLKGAVSARSQLKERTMKNCKAM